MRVYSWVMMTHVGGFRPRVMSLCTCTTVVAIYMIGTHSVALRPSVGELRGGRHFPLDVLIFDRVIGSSDLPTLSSCERSA